MLTNNLLGMSRWICGIVLAIVCTFFFLLSFSSAVTQFRAYRRLFFFSFPFLFSLIPAVTQLRVYRRSFLLPSFSSPSLSHSSRRLPSGVCRACSNACGASQAACAARVFSVLGDNLRRRYLSVKGRCFAIVMCLCVHVSHSEELYDLFAT